MSTLKNLSLLFLSLIILFSSVIVVSAQSLILPELYIQDLVLEKAEYKSGETVSGSFIVYNSKTASVPDAYYEIMLVGNYQSNGLAGVVYDRVLKGPIFVSGQELKKVDFTYTLPGAIAGDKLGIQVGARTSAGIPLGWSDAMLKITGGLPLVNVISAGLNVDGRNFGLQNGPTVYQDKTGELAVTITSNSTENFTLIPKVVIYNRTVGTTPLSENTLPTINILANKAQEKYNVNFALPTFDYKPGVYAGRLDLIDAQGLRRASPIDFRYIIAGDIFTIQGVSVDKESVKKGEDVKLTAAFTGSTYDIVTLETTGAEEADLAVELYDQRGKIVARYTELVNFNKVQSQIFTLKAEKDAEALAVKIVISKNGEILTTYSSVLSENFSEKGEDFNLWSIIMYAVIAILIVIIFFLLLRKKNKNTSIPLAGFLIALGLFGAVNVSQAYTLVSENTEAGKFSPSITISKPTENQKAAAGVLFNAMGSVYTSFCANDPQQVRITATLRGTNQVFSQYYDYSYSKVNSVTCTNPNDGDSCSINWTSQFSLGAFKAPATSGTYYIDLKVEAYHDKKIYSTKIVAQPFMVVSPYNLTASCPAPGTSATLSWIGGAGAQSYILGVNNTDNGWKGDCAVAQFVGDQCVSNQPTNTYTFAGIPGAAYTWWVHSTANGVTGQATGGTNFICATSTPIATCSDGIQNQGETGIDCGGPCPACSTPPDPDPDNPGNGDNNGDDDGGNDDIDNFIIDYEPYTPDPNLNCTVSMTSPSATSVNVNTNTTWTASAPNCLDCTKYWSLQDSNNQNQLRIATTTNNFINYIFTTIGEKTILAQFTQTIDNVRYAGNPCSATTNVVQTGGGINEI